MIMDFLRNIGETVNSAVDFVVEKNRKFTKISKIKRLIKKESDTIIRSYITLGKHYYSDLKNVPNKDMQKVCSNIDLAKTEIKRLKKRLAEINTEQSYTKFRDLADDEPIDVEFYVDDCHDHCTCCHDDHVGICNCGASDCECNNEFEKENTCDLDDGNTSTTTAPKK